MVSLVDVLTFNDSFKRLNDDQTIKTCQTFQEIFGNQLFKQLIFYGASKIANCHDIDKLCFANLIQTVQYVF